MSNDGKLVSKRVQVAGQRTRWSDGIHHTISMFQREDKVLKERRETHALQSTRRRSAPAPGGDRSRPGQPWLPETVWGCWQAATTPRCSGPRQELSGGLPAWRHCRLPPRTRPDGDSRAPSGRLPLGSDRIRRWDRLSLGLWDPASHPADHSQPGSCYQEGALDDWLFPTRRGLTWE